MASIHSVLMHIESDAVGGSNFDKGVMKIGLRNLKLLHLLLLRFARADCYNEPLFSMIENAVASSTVIKEINMKVVDEVHSLGKELDDELSDCMSDFSNLPSVFSVEELVWITGTILENAADFLALNKQLHEYEVIEAFEVHVRINRNFLLFASRAGVELERDCLLLSHVLPVVIHASRAFIECSGAIPRTYDLEKGVYIYASRPMINSSRMASNCSRVIRMATDPQLYQAYARALSTSRLSYTWEWDEDDAFKNFIGSLISLLWDVLSRGSGSGIEDQQLKGLYEGLRFSRAILKSIWEDEIRAQIGDMICSSGVLICSLHQPDTARLSDLLQRFDVLRARAEVETKANEELGSADFAEFRISDERDQLALEFNMHTPLINIPQVVCFKDDEMTSVLDRLTRGSKQLRRIPISGMAGLGKTTFASKLFNHPSVVSHFRARAWCTISQVLDKNKVLFQLLKQIHDLSEINASDMTEDDLANKLRQSLKRKRYLIVLDDVWTPGVWSSLEASFPNDATDSRVVLTSRNHDIAPHALLDEQPHLLRLREDHECLEILQAKLHQKQGWTDELGMKIAERCKGLPLTVVILAGLLATTEQDGWKRILDDLISGGLSGAESALELSYKHLPEYLQPCFLYFGAFSEDEEVSVQRLIRLWMAEEFVRKSNSMRVEDVAREYMDKLIERSLVMVAKKRSIGGVSSYRIHDLAHDFCRKKSKQENLFHLLLQRHDQLSDFSEPRNCIVQRLFIHSSADHFKASGLFCPRALSLLFFSAGESAMDSRLFDMSFIVQIFQILKVLDIHQISLVNGIPSSIDLLARLRYLSIQSALAVVPSSIGNLPDLETLIAYFPSHRVISFPDTIWCLHRLKYLYVNCNGNGGFTLPVEGLENSSILSDLDTICGVVFCSDDGSMEKQMQKFPNVRRLKCSIQSFLESREENKIVVSEFPSQLESLTIYGKGRLQFEFGLRAGNLRKLKLDGFELSREDISVIGKFPNLEVLKLFGMIFPEDALEMEECEFPKLRFLTLYLPYGLERWTVSDDQLPCSQKLVFGYCTNLEEIPSCLGTIETLEEIEVLKCSSILESLVRDIEEEQKDFGNSVKVHIKS